MTCKKRLLSALAQLSMLASGSKAISTLEAIVQQCNWYDSRSVVVGAACDAIWVVLTSRPRQLKQAMQRCGITDVDGFEESQLEMLAMISYLGAGLEALFANSCASSDDRSFLLQRMQRTGFIEEAAVIVTCALVGGVCSDRASYTDALALEEDDASGICAEFCRQCLENGCDAEWKRQMFMLFKNEQLINLYDTQYSGASRLGPAPSQSGPGQRELAGPKKAQAEADSLMVAKPQEKKGWGMSTVEKVRSCCNC